MMNVRESNICMFKRQRTYKTNILMSMKPEYAEMIFQGNKQYEFRKHGFKRQVEKVFVYSTKPVSRIVGFFTFSEILMGSPFEIWNSCSEFAGVSEFAFFDYFKKRDVAYAIKIDRVSELSRPVPPSEIMEAFKPPRSFMYMDGSFGVNLEWL